MSTAFERDESSIVEFQLGNKQLFLLFLGLLVICAIFFFIGLRVGEDTAQARIPVNLSDDGGASTDSGQTLDLQPLSQQQVTPVKEETTNTTQRNETASEQNNTANRQSEVKQPETAKQTENKAARNTNTETKKPETKPQQQIANTGIFVQVIATENAQQARKIRQSLAGNHSTQIQKATVNGKVYNRVLVGPFKSKNEAGKYRDTIKGKYKGAFINVVR